MKQIVRADNNACGHLRMIWPAEALIANGDNEIINTRSVFAKHPTTHSYFQRVGEQKIFDIFKDIDGKKIVDYDDMIFKMYGEGYPSYNFVASHNKIEESTKALLDNMDKIDTITTSTEFLKKAIMDNFGYDAIKVIPNFLPRWIYHFDRCETLAKKPRVLYAGGLTHYGQDGKDTGDFRKPVIEFLRKNIDKIELVFIGPVPWFLSDLKSKIYSVPFVNILNFPRLLKNLDTDFYLAPLKENIFNKCKSNLKYLEACAIGSVCIGSVFPDSPYSMIHDACQIRDNMTADDISKMFWNMNNPINWRYILDYQYKYINTMWLENNIGLYESLLSVDKVSI